MKNKYTFKCCQLTTVHQWDDVRIYHKMAKSLAGAGYDVHLVAPAEPGTIAPNVTLHAVPKIGGRLSRIWKRQPLALLKILSLKPDIVHFHDPELLPLGLLLRLLGYKVIYDVHEDVAAQIQAKPWIAPALRKNFGRYFRVFERFAAKQMSGVVIAWSKIGIGLIGSNCTLIQNFPALSEFSTGTVKKSNEASENAIVYVGGLTEERGLRTMLDAVELARNPVRFKIGGKFSNADFKKVLEAKKAWVQTDFLGWLGRKEVSEIISSSNVGMLTLYETPNHLAALPIKLFEYFAAGKPIIASNFPYWRELSEGNCIFVDPKSPQQIADAIDWVIENPAEAEAMGQRGKKIVFEKCNWERESGKLLALYSHILGVT